MRYFRTCTGRLASIFCFGCEPLGGFDWGSDVSIGDIERSIRVSLEHGVTFFDTADVYGLGESERRLGNILGPDRHSVVIATKGGVAWNHEVGDRAKTRLDNSSEYLRYAVDRSLERLRLDTIPIYFLHWPERDVDIRKSVYRLNELKEKGKIEAVGLSNVGYDQLKSAVDEAPIRYLQVPFNILDEDIDSRIIELCKLESIRLVAYNVLALGALAGKFTSATRFSSGDRRKRDPNFSGDQFERRLQRIEKIKLKAARRGMTAAQYAIEQITEHEYISSVIVGVKTNSQLLENLIPFE